MSIFWPKVEVRINLRDVLFDRIESAIESGWNRAHKHVDSPSPDIIKSEIFNAIENDICELLSWGDDGDEQ
jgi:hypothetical protein